MNQPRIRTNSPNDNLCVAISILQAHILAQDSSGNPEVIFGNFHFSTSALEHAVALLVELLGPTEKLTWNGTA